jgi:Tfp pilus assembly protein PilP
MRTWILPVVLGLAGAADAGAQGAAPAATPPAGQAQAAGATPPAASQQAPAPVEAASYVYQPEGRRDPFLSLVGTGITAPLLPSQRPEGVNGLAVGEISVRGVLQSKNAYVAMVQGPDNKSYVIHQGDKFLDGVVKSVTAEGLVIVQNVNDPLSLVKQREVRKFLRSHEDIK